jgi:hypothetical protein
VIHSIILSYFQRRTNAITEAGRQISAADWRESSTAMLGRRLEDEMPSLFAGRSLAITAHGGYSRAETSVEITFRTATANEALVDVEEYERQNAKLKRRAPDPGSARRGPDRHERRAGARQGPFYTKIVFAAQPSRLGGSGPRA